MIKRGARITLLLPVAVKARVLATRQSRLFAIVLGLALSLGVASISWAVPKQNGMPGKQSATITATPARVKVTAGSGTSDLAWNTGDGSIGFVFVTANGRPPVLVAAGTEGSQTISWIQTGSYVFGLYGDAEGRNLLSTATVSGFIAESPRAGLLSGELLWLVIAVLIAVLYVGVYLSSTGPVPTKFPLEPTTSPRPLHVTRNLLFGVAAFICIDGVVFHTQLYTSILAPDSYAGRMAAITRAERNRVSSGLKEILVLGDSRMAEGFSAAIANNLSSVDGYKFVNL